MSVIKSNEFRYQALINNEIKERILGDEYLDVEKFLKEYKKENSLLNLIHNDVIDLAKLAHKYNGFLFGGIVRSFLLKKEHTKDIDIWLYNDKEFIKEIEKYWNGTKIDEYIKNDFNVTNYPFEKTKYIITSPKTDFVYNIDIVVNNELPVNDYDVNCLLFNGYNFSSFDNQSYKSILIHIYTKEMQMLDSYKNTHVNNARKNKFKKSG